MNKSAISIIGVAFLSPATPFTTTPFVLSADIGTVDCHLNERKDCAPHPTHVPEGTSGDEMPRVHIGDAAIVESADTMRAAGGAVVSATGYLTTASG